MDKAIEQIFKTFNHVARELQVYFLSGFLVLLNLYFIDHAYFSGSLWRHSGQNSFLIPIVIIVGYILGHLCMAVYFVLLEWTKLERVINKLLGFEMHGPAANLPLLFQRNTSLYLHFVERYVLLALMRWNLSAAFFIMALTNFSFAYFLPYQNRTFMTASAFLIISFFLYMLTLATEKEKTARVKSIADLPEAPKV